jgi:UDP-N-acetylmuramoyl-tripeptide--D-alanyl-D-alanine ligase
VTQFSWTTAEVLKALKGHVLEQPPGPEGEFQFSDVSTDTRTVSPGQLFVALIGERFDAHEYLGEAMEAGARGAVVSRIPSGAPEGLIYFVVDNTLTALAALARHRRRLLRARVVGVAGSNGKTTTKDLLRAALSSRFVVHATAGNLNNQIGVPLTLLAAPDDAEAVVVEMGTNEPGEIAILTSIVEPDAAIVTSVAEEHLEKLGDLEGVLREESSIFEGLGPDGVGFVADEPPALPERARELLGSERVRVAGLGAEADLHPDGGAEAIQLLPDGTTRWSWRGVELHLPLPGRHNVRNALLALGLSAEWGVPPADAARGLQGMTAPKLRGEWHRIGSLRVLADCYNANPPSMSAAVDLLASLPDGGRKIAVVGTMRELGPESATLHRRAAEEIASKVEKGIDLIIATGDFVDAFSPFTDRLGEHLTLCPDPVEAYAMVGDNLRGDETILLKGSRGVALERWIPLLQRDWDRGSDS